MRKVKSVDLARKWQFDLRSMLGYMTLGGVLFSASSMVGIGSMIGLMLMALALWWRQGLLALMMWAIIFKFSGSAPAEPSGSVIFLETTVLPVVVVAWYRYWRLMNDDALIKATQVKSDDLGPSEVGAQSLAVSLPLSPPARKREE